MYLYEELLDYANRIKKVAEDNPGKMAEINMGLAQTIRMEYLSDWVEMLEREIK